MVSSSESRPRATRLRHGLGRRDTAQQTEQKDGDQTSAVWDHGGPTGEGQHTSGETPEHTAGNSEHTYSTVCDYGVSPGSDFSWSLCRRQSCCWMRMTTCWSQCMITGWGKGRTVGVRPWFLRSNRRKGTGPPTTMPTWPSDAGRRRCRPGRSVLVYGQCCCQQL